MESIWTKTCQIEERHPLTNDLTTEVVVIGAGMAGLLIAFTLQEIGMRVIVLEANRIASGQTRNTTAKITSQHGLIYSKLAQTLGSERARLYGKANESALREYQRIIKEKNIDCDFEEQHAFFCAHNADAVFKEAQCGASLGLPASFIVDKELPFPVSEGILFENQAQFHPLKFLREISASLTIYEKTPVLKLHDHTIHTPRGKVTAKKIIFACHYPFINFPGLFFTRMHQQRSYVLALANASPPDGMFLYNDKQDRIYSLRHYKDLILFGGSGHRCGENGGFCYDHLRNKAREWFPQSKEVACWSAQDCITGDSLPFIGRYAAFHSDWFVATGFQKWGMTTSMVAAMVLKDLLRGKPSPYATLYEPNRFNMMTLSEVMNDSGHALKGLTERLFLMPSKRPEHIPAEHGGIISFRHKKAGVYKDRHGNNHFVKVHCPHLGCELQWNDDEKSWDCPCHGSRFDRFGKLISGPAQKGLTIPK